MEIQFRCGACGNVSLVESDSTQVPLTCGQCGKQFGAMQEFADDTGGVRYCGICGCRDLYTQKDFSRRVGCTIAAIGAVLAPFTKLISLFVCALIDLVLYRILPFITVCYRCHAVFRDFPRNPEHEGFNLGINDRYRASERQ